MERVCPSFGADWTEPGSVWLGYHAEVLCWACLTFHRSNAKAGTS